MGNDELQISLGALCDPLAVQLKGKTNLTQAELKTFDKVSNAITLLHIHGYIPDAATDKARAKLMKNLVNRSQKKK